MNDNEAALMRYWAGIALQSEGCDPMRDIVARFILDNINDPYEEIEEGSVWIVKLNGQERVAVRGDDQWYLCETDAYISEESKAVELVSELVPKDDDSRLTPEKSDHPTTLLTAGDYDSAPVGTIVIYANNVAIKIEDETWRWAGLAGAYPSNDLAAVTDENGGCIVMRWGK
ncbi:hypothetical protein SEA_STICKYNOTE_82 [Corynebacterium phage Stickynote]|uniref:Uncharacterized protein n=1 Tax=Corynebacterium phage Stickynote TaxID=2588503 RepID=A0A4Y6EMI7_9CAUD|nr:hypothetical protein KNU65_gp60 [Corynebacterium phage Stickynote]QDF19275.1 hypothetical protein SEA_STICKYNOTE_82 [Corynebacterium phage Stickynote]